MFIIRQEADRAAHQRHLAKGTRPATFEEGVAMIREAHKAPQSIEGLLTKRGPYSEPRCVIEEPPRREHDFRRPEDQAEALALIKAAHARPLSDARFCTHIAPAGEPPAASPAVTSAPSARPPAADPDTSVSGAALRAAHKVFGDARTAAAPAFDRLAKRSSAPAATAAMPVANAGAVRAAIAAGRHLIFDGSGTARVVR